MYATRAYSLTPNLLMDYYTLTNEPDKFYAVVIK